VKPETLEVFQEVLPPTAPACAHAGIARRVLPLHRGKSYDPHARRTVAGAAFGLIEGAPETVLSALAHILLAKIYRKQIEACIGARYRGMWGAVTRGQGANDPAIRGRKRLRMPQGHVYDLNEIFEDLNTRYFHGLLGRHD